MNSLASGLLLDPAQICQAATVWVSYDPIDPTNVLLAKKKNGTNVLSLNCFLFKKGTFLAFFLLYAISMQQKTIE